MFSIDNLNNIEPLSIYLARPSGEIIGCLDDEIEEKTVSLTIGLNQKYELTFTITKRNDIDTSWYDRVVEGMYLFIPRIGLFKMYQPKDTLDGIKGSKSIEAYSCDTELDDKTIQLDLNMGLETSQEYLVVYDDDETESLVNPYTNIPYDWLVLYNTFPEQLQIVYDKYNSGYYGSKSSNGDTVITNTALIDELQDLFTLIPRLKSKIIETVDSNGISDFSLVEWVIYDYVGDTSEVYSITLTSDFPDRVQYLITFYTKYRDQLSLLSVILSKTDENWTVGNIYGVSDGDYTLANKKYQFSTDETIYAFLTNTLAQKIECVVNFDITNRKVNVTPADVVGNDTGITMSYDNLISTMNITTTDDQLCTRLYLYGADELSVEQVNFGNPYIDDIRYKLNVRDNNGDRIYVTDDLAEKYLGYLDYMESLRDEYIQCSKDYNSYLEEISEIKYRMPNDSLQTDWGTYSLDELESALTNYKNLLAALISLYKDDYGEAGMNEDGSVNENYIRQTMYWYDYAAYKATITNIECAISTYPYYSDEDKWTAGQTGTYKDAIKAWETEWSLYGIVELQARIATYTQNMSLLAETSVIRVSSDVDEIKTWDELTDDERAEFGDMESNYYYDAYMTYYNNKKAAQEYLDELQEQVDELEEKQTEVQKRRTQIVSDVSMSSYFTAEECKILNRLFREYTYTNENILTTSLNTVVDTIDVQYELLEDGKDQASIQSRPQLNFEITSDNLLGLPEFESFWEDFQPGNYMMIQYRDNTYVKLRMVSYTFNPLLPSSSDFSMTFSNYIRSRTGLSDVESMLGLATSSGGSSGGSGSGSGGLYGESDDIDVTISNTMLAQLLNSETFGTRVTNVVLDTIDANMMSSKFANFTGLAGGTTKISGFCIQSDAILSNNYDDVTKNSDGYVTKFGMNGTQGSIIDLMNGQFNFGGGGLTWDGDTLKVSNASITATNNINAITINPNSQNLFKISKNNNDLLWVDSEGVLHITGDGAGLYITLKDDDGNDQEYTIENAFSVTKSGLEEEITNAANDVIGRLALTVNETTGETTLTGKANYIHFSSSQLLIESDQFTLDLGGNATFSGELKAASGSFSGSITATNNINTITIDPDSSNLFKISKSNDDLLWVDNNGVLHISGDGSGLDISSNDTTGEIKASLVLSIEEGSDGKKRGVISANADYISLGTSDLEINSDQFQLDLKGNATFSGNLNAASGSFSGDIKATSGYIGSSSTNGWNIGSTSIYNGTSSISSTTVGTYIGTNGIRQYTSQTYLNILDGEIDGGYNGQSDCSIDFSISVNPGSSVSTNIEDTEGRHFGVALANSTRGGMIMFQADQIWVNRPNASSSSLGKGSTEEMIYGGSRYFNFINGILISTSASSVGSSSVPVYIDSNGQAHECYLSRLYDSSDIALVMTDGSSDHFEPVKDDTVYLGGSSHLWKTVYATNQTINQSDINEKENITEITEQYEDLFMLLRPVNYSWKNFKDTDNHDRTHCGLIAQEVEESCEQVGLNSTTFAALCKDTLKDPTVDGRTERYGLAYGELHGLEIHMIQKSINEQKQLENEIEALRAENETLQDRLAQLEEIVGKE